MICMNVGEATVENVLAVKSRLAPESATHSTRGALMSHASKLRDPELAPFGLRNPHRFLPTSHSLTLSLHLTTSSQLYIHIHSTKRHPTLAVGTTSTNQATFLTYATNTT